MYTITLNELVNYGLEIFPDFEFNNISIFGKVITKEDFINKFYDYYGAYEIAFSQPDEFIFEFRRIFDKNYDAFIKKIEVFNSINYNLEGYTRNINRNVDSDNKYSDTPNEPMKESTDIYLTNRSIDKSTGQTNEIYKENEVEKYNKISEKIKNIIYEFYDLFDCLFLNYISLKTFSRRI